MIILSLCEHHSLYASMEIPQANILPVSLWHIAPDVRDSAKMLTFIDGTSFVNTRGIEKLVLPLHATPVLIFHLPGSMLFSLYIHHVKALTCFCLSRSSSIGGAVWMQVSRQVGCEHRLVGLAKYS